MPQQARRDSGGGGLFGWFGRGNDEQEAQQPETPVYRSIDPNGRYRSVLRADLRRIFLPGELSDLCQPLGPGRHRLPVELRGTRRLYVYRNPGQEIDQAISLNGTAYADLPAAFKYRKSYIKGCSCKADEYNPTEIEAANQKAERRPRQAGPARRRVPRRRPRPAAPARSRRKSM